MKLRSSECQCSQSLPKQAGMEVVLEAKQCTKSQLPLPAVVRFGWFMGTP